MQAFRLLLNDSDMLAYLSMMAPRLIEMHRVLKPDGSIYLHCDPTASHYLKILMDAVFGPVNFRNEISWCYRKWSVAQSQFTRNHDVIFFYSKSKENTFNTQYVPLSEGTIKRRKGKKQQAEFDEHGRRLATNLEVESKGTPMPDWWEVSIINPNAKERLGYPTQKPEALLERIIKASSNEGDLVLDPFCGCGTTISVSQRLNRNWIGIDITHLAVGLMKHRLQDTFGDEVEYEVIGEPVSLEGAKTLAKQDPYQFQWWALGLVGARPNEQKKGADAGIDGRIYFHDDAIGDTKQVIISVKAGKPHLTYMRDLRGVVDRENAEIGVLITMQEPTQPMKAEAASGGFYESPGWRERYPKLQILTIEELLDGKCIEMPPIGQVNVTFKKAPKSSRDKASQPGLGLDDLTHKI
jgi:site-specific DNA-methyltransferase (adenine-specific)